MPKTFRSLKFKVFTTDMKSWQNFVIEPPVGKLWPADVVHQEASKFVYELEEQFPGNIFQLIKKRAGHYTVIPMDSPKMVLTEQNA